MASLKNILISSPLYGHSKVKHLWEAFGIPDAYKKRGISFGDAYCFWFLKKPNHSKKLSLDERRSSYLIIENELSKRLSSVPAGENKHAYRQIMTMQRGYAFLKQAQKHFNKDISGYLDRGMIPYISACLKNTSYIANAKAHAGKRYVFLTDIENFLGHVNRDKVIAKLQEFLHIDRDAAEFYGALLTSPTYEDPTKFVLGQGLPSSPILAILTNLELFDHIYRECQSRHYEMTIYVDDLTISSPTPIDADFRNKIFGWFKQNGLPLSNHKTHYLSPDQVKRITGLYSYDGETLIPNRRRERMMVYNEYLKKPSEYLVSLEKYYQAYNIYLRFQGLFNEVKTVELMGEDHVVKIPQKYSGFYKTVMTLRPFFPLPQAKKNKDFAYSVSNVNRKLRIEFSKDYALFKEAMSRGTISFL